MAGLKGVLSTCSLPTLARFSDNSIEYDFDASSVDPGWKGFKAKEAPKLAGLAVEDRLAGEQLGGTAPSLKDFIPRKPLSHRLAEVIEELL